MEMPTPLKKILDFYESDCPGTKAQLVRLLMHGKLSGTGHLVIYPIDQGFEHGPGRSFSMNPQAYDPSYHINLALKAGLSGFAAPLGFLEAIASSYAGRIPLILKVNSGTSLMPSGASSNQAITGSVEDALRLGCVAIGYTIYPGSDHTYEMFEKLQLLTQEAKAAGLAVVVWSYPRGHLSKEGEQALNVIAYGAHMAALLGAHIIKVKLPTDFLEKDASLPLYEKFVPRTTLKERVAHVVQSCFNGRRLVVFSGGEAQDVKDILKETQAIYEGGGTGSIIGRNCFKRPEAEALSMLDDIVQVYQGHTPSCQKKFDPPKETSYEN